MPPIHKSNKFSKGYIPSPLLSLVRLLVDPIQNIVLTYRDNMRVLGLKIEFLAKPFARPDELRLL